MEEAEALVNLISTVGRLEEENARLTKMFVDDCYIESANLEPGHYDIRLGGKGCMLLCGQLLRMFHESGGENFVTSGIEFAFSDKEKMESYELTIQKVAADDSPAQKITRLDEENAMLREILKEVCNGNSLAVERGESIANWPGSYLQRKAKAALAPYERTGDVR